jgi:hypothetical protein
MAEFAHGFLVLALGAIQLGALPEHLLDAVGLGAVRIFNRFAFGVVLAVNGHPFLGHLARAQPEPETEEMRGDRVQVHGAVRLMAMQVDRHAGDGDVGGHQRVQHDLPPAGGEQSISQPIEGGIKQDHKSPLNNQPQSPIQICLQALQKITPHCKAIPHKYQVAFSTARKGKVVRKITNKYVTSGYLSSFVAKNITTFAILPRKTRQSDAGKARAEGRVRGRVFLHVPPLDGSIKARFQGR